MDVGVRDLKAHLSEYLARAAAGEVITVTDRGRPTALLSPIPRASLDRGIDEGWITPPVRRGLAPVRRQQSDRSARATLDEDRGDD